MAQFDPFEREFRRRSQGLRRTPDQRTWERLEDRLNGRRRPVTRILRPWMVAALFVLAAGLALISQVRDTTPNPLAQRSEVIQELSAPYQPVEAFEPIEYWDGVPTSETASEIRPEFRDLPVNEKFRS